MSDLPAPRGGAKALLLTVLGEFVLPAGGMAWTSTMLAASDTLGINEKNARQALARLGDQALIESERVGRRARWRLTGAGRTLLEAGTERIYGFGRSSTDWGGEWLLVHSPIAETQRATRGHLRSELAFQGFGELSASLAISPHTEREGQLRGALDSLGVTQESLVLRSRTGSAAEDADIVKRAWDVPALGDKYAEFVHRHDTGVPTTASDAFCAQVALVHDWRRFPFVDPELPGVLLPADWAGSMAVEFFHTRHGQLSQRARNWFSEQDD